MGGKGKIGFMPSHVARETVILIAEDDAIIRNLVNLMLGKAGYAVLVAADGLEALEICEKFSDPIHLLLTNINMPGMDGHALRDAVRAQRSDIRVIVMSGNLDKAIVEGNRPDAFLQKPFIPPTLLKLVQDVLNGDAPPLADL
jgi:two-component system cell cycle sensor histidine kinase/response regulator CckA